MSMLATLKMLGGATVLRALETYKLLFLRFWWLMGILALWTYYPLLYLYKHHRSYGRTSYLPGASDVYVPAVLSVATLILLIILLSRSSMVRKDWRYVLRSPQTVHGIVWEGLSVFLGASLLFFLRDFWLMFDQPARLILLTIALSPSVLWAYCLLDMKLVWWRYPVILVQSFGQMLRLLYHNILGLLALDLITGVTTYVFFSVITFLEHVPRTFDYPVYLVLYWPTKLSFFMGVLLIFPWFLGFIAVLYEHMRYRVEGL
jgi:hypothetical protein